MMPCFPIAAACKPEFVDAVYLFVYVGVPVLRYPYSTSGHSSRRKGGSTLFFALAASENKSLTISGHCSCRTRGGDAKRRLVSTSRNSGRMIGRSSATPKTNRFVTPVMLACLQPRSFLCATCTVFERCLFASVLRLYCRRSRKL